MKTPFSVTIELDRQAIVFVITDWHINNGPDDCMTNKEYHACTGNPLLDGYIDTDWSRRYEIDEKINAQVENYEKTSA